jgi:type III restriction enzyme
MPSFIAKGFQRSVLESVQDYFLACHELPSPSAAFTVVTERRWGSGSPYRAIEGFPPDMPYFCLRVPTGGGKTWLAAKSVAMVNRHLLRSEYSVILWLVPSNAIRTQTLKALKDRHHPYRAALCDAGEVTVMDIDEAKYVTRATLDTSTVVIVSTVQAFRREDTEGLKVFESNGALMHHFDGIAPDQEAFLLRDDNGVAPRSLANVLRMRRPFVVVDEAHNNRTDLSFRTFADFRPSGILELTATPDTARTPSNVLHSVSAAELKAEEMIKLPILLETEPDWQKCLAYAIDRRSQLQAVADKERRSGAAYLRPIVLIQAEKRHQARDTLHVDRVREELISNHRVPPSEIIVATGEERGLEKLAEAYSLGIADESCPVKYVLTQQALAEGWDCPSAYILVSMAEMRAATAVEQLLGRILRQPDARRRDADSLNQSYAFVVSRDFGDTARSLRDRLVEGAGFEHRDAVEFVMAAKPEQAAFDLSARPGRIIITPVSVPLTGAPDLKSLPKELRDKVEWDRAEKLLTINWPVSAEEAPILAALVNEPAARQAVERAAEESRTRAIEFFRTPSETGVLFAVPQLALRMQDEFQLHDDDEVLEYEFELSVYDAAPGKDDLDALSLADRISSAGTIDVTESGAVSIQFMHGLQRDFGLSYRPEHWDEVKLIAWLCRNLPDPASTHESLRAFVAKWMQKLLQTPGYDLARANRQKFLIRNRLEAAIRGLRHEAVKVAFQKALFAEDAKSRIRIGGDFNYLFAPQGYAPTRDYDHRYGLFDFRKHYYGRIGDFDSQEEFDCACWLDQQAQRGRIEYWVRNLVRKEACSFFLQKAGDRFFPDFLCQLPRDVVLAVEYKGADRWAGAEDDRLIGGLWEELSGGRCRFVMTKDRNWAPIDTKL